MISLNPKSYTENATPIITNGAVRVRGSGGGSSKSGSTSNDRNTLRSKATFNLIEVISEGEIYGLVNGEKSIYFDETAILNDDGTYNFEGIEWEQHVGLADEGYFNGHNAVESSEEVETQVKASVGPVVRTIVDEEVDAVRVIVRIPSLVHQDDGALKTTSVSYAIDYRNYEGSWTEALVNNLTNEKCLSPMQIAHEIDLPAGGAPWDVRVRRITADSEDDDLQNDTYWEGYVKLVKGKFMYPHSAAIAISGNAEDMGSNIPARAYHVKGLLINIPSNYDPEARTYEGIWDGTFKIGWTNNPAWIFYDLIVNERYGLGEFIQAASVDKWSLYTIAQYCDGSVKSGFKNGDTGEDIYEPRFTFNGVINSRDEAYYVLQTITKAWRGMGYWALGQVFATADMPTDPTMIVSPANVIGGSFDYSSTARKARHSVVMVKWNNPDNFYNPDTAVVIDTKLLHKDGWNEKSLTLAGCTSRGLAHRYGKWIIDTEHHETETVTYSASWDHAQLRPGEVVAISDPRKAQVRAAGRIVSHDNDALTVTLDDDFEANDGEMYQLMLVMPSGEVVTKDITSFLSAHKVLVSEAFPDTAKPDAMWTIKGSDINPRNYRVISVDEVEANEFKITALFHDPLKFARVEENITLEAITYERPSKVSSPPTNLLVTETGYVSNGDKYHSLTISWTAPEIPCRGFVVSVDTPDGDSFTLGTTAQSQMELLNTVSGAYKFYVQTIAYSGTVSAPATIEFAALGVSGYALPTVTDLTLVDRPTETEFVSTDLKVQWQNNFASRVGGPVAHISSPHYDYNTVRVYANASGALLRETNVVGEEYTYDFATNIADSKSNGLSGASRALRIEVEIHDKFGRVSEVTSKVFTNPAPAALTPTSNVAGNTIFLGYSEVEDLDFSGVLIFRSTSAGTIDTANDTPFYKGLNNPLTVYGDFETTYYFKMAAYDAFGETSLNWTSEFSITTLGNGADVEPPEVPTGLAVTSSISNGMAHVVVTWNANDEDDLAGYDLQIKQPSGNWVTFPLVSTTYEFDVLPNTAYQFQVRARDKNANSSAFSAIVSHTSVSDTTPPGDVTGVSITAGLTSIWLEWTNPTDKDLAYVEVWEGSTSTFANATMIATLSGSSLARTGLASEVTRYYWLRPVDTSGNKGNLTAVVSTTTAETPESKRMSLAGLSLTPNSPTTNSVAWTACTVSVGKPGATPVTKTVVAGNVAWASCTIYIYYVEGETTFRTTTTMATIFVNSGYAVATYTGGTNVQLATGKTAINGSDILAGTVGASQLVSNSAIITGAAQIADAIITSAKIVSLSADKIQSNTVLADSILVGSDTLATIADRAAAPAATINSGSTLIAPGKIQLSGTTSLASWQSGSDATLIDGGSVSANSIQANSLTIGSRGITVLNITFEHNDPSTNQVSWTSGYIQYTNDSGSSVTSTISASYGTWTTGTLYLYWVKGASTLSTTTSFATANGANNVILATYRGGTSLVSSYGRTVIDGGLIKTQSIRADQIAAATITATQLAADSVTASAISVTSLAAISANLGAITGGSLNINSKFVVDSSGNVTIKSGTSGARLEMTNSLVKVYDSAGTLRVRLGIW